MRSATSSIDFNECSIRMLTATARTALGGALSLNRNQELRGKAAIITGGAKGIGRVTAELFVDRGAKVVLVGRDSSAGAQVIDELGQDFSGSGQGHSPRWPGRR